MKKYIAIFLILIGLISTTFISIPAFTKNIFTEGVYKSSDFNFSEDKTYFVYRTFHQKTLFS